MDRHFDPRNIAYIEPIEDGQGLTITEGLAKSDRLEAELELTRQRLERENTTPDTQK